MVPATNGRSRYSNHGEQSQLRRTRHAPGGFGRGTLALAL